MIKLKDLLKDFLMEGRADEGGPGSGRARKGRAPKLQEPWDEPATPVKHTSKLSRKSRSKHSDPTARQVRRSTRKPGQKPPRAPKLKQFGEAGLPAMTTQQKNRLISKIHGYDRNRLTQMLRSAAKEANRGDARAQDLALIYHNELNNRDRMGYGGL